MRYALILLATVTLLAAQEAEVVTFKDGRVLTGYVLPIGPHRARLELVDPQGAVITISLDEVVSRELLCGAPEACSPGRPNRTPPRADNRRSRAALSPPITLRQLRGLWRHLVERIRRGAGLRPNARHVRRAHRPLYRTVPGIT